MSNPTLSSLEKIAEGREAELFAYGPGRVLRLYREGHNARAAKADSIILPAAAAAGVRVPTFYGLETVAGRQGVILERIDGRDVLIDIARKPWRLWTLSRACARLQAHLNEQPAPASLPAARDSLRDKIERAADAPPEFVDAASKRLESLPDGDRILHADFHPGNVMLGQGDDPVIIDWSNACRGTAEIDFARTGMMLRLGDPAPGTPFIITFFSHFARSLMIRTYERTYRDSRQVDEDLLRACQLPIAVARLSEHIPSEVPKLHKYIRELIDRDS